MWNDTDTPLAYFISFRGYGTWLHGDQRGSIDRLHNQYRSPYIPANDIWRTHNERQLKANALILARENVNPSRKRFVKRVRFGNGRC